MNYEFYSEKLLNNSLSRYHLSSEVIEAYRACPRHLFIQEDYPMEEKYADYPLGIYRDRDFESTISQPSFVLLMLDMLDLKPGQKVIELGTGSGWNAALMSYLVEPHGKVISLEIIPKLASETKENLRVLGVSNVEIIHGDGAHGYEPEAPYDRGIFTAGAVDLPEAFHQQIKVGGKLLFVLKGYSEADLLILLEKKSDHFAAIKTLTCQFIPIKGEGDFAPDSQSDDILQSRGKIRIYPRKGPLPEGGERVVRKDSVFYF